MACVGRGRRGGELLCSVREKGGREGEGKRKEKKNREKEKKKGRRKRKGGREKERGAGGIRGGDHGVGRARAAVGRYAARRAEWEKKETGRRLILVLGWRDRHGIWSSDREGLSSMMKKI